MKTPIRYAGGKSKAYNTITEHLPFFPKPKRIVSPFMGGGSLEVRWASEQNIPVVGFDVFWCLTNYWKNQLNNPREVYEILHSLTCSKETYKRNKFLAIKSIFVFFSLLISILFSYESTVT